MKRGFVNKIKAFLTRDRLMEIFRFVINGGLSFVVDFGLLYLLTDIFHVNYLLSAGISFTASVIFNYILCVKWVFKGAEEQDAKSKLIFVGSSVIGLGLNEILMWLFVSIFGLHYLLAKIIATGIVMIWNYVAKRWALVK